MGYMKLVNRFKVFFSITKTYNGLPTVPQTEHVIDLSDIKDDDLTNVLDRPALLTIKADSEESKTIRVMLPYADQVKTLYAWQAIQNCILVKKVFNTGTTISDDNIFLTQ